MSAPEIRYDEESGRVAIKTELPGIRSWFVFHPEFGGHYTPGNTAVAFVEEWPAYGSTG